jgi:tight adherence protein C
VNFLIVLVSVLISVFIFLFLIKFSYKDTRLIIGAIESRTENIVKKYSRNKLNEDLKLLFKEQNGVKVFCFKIKSLEGLFLLRIILSLSFFIFILIIGFFLKKNFVWHSLITAIVIYFIPSEVIRGKINSKSKKIQNELPDIIDILSSLIKAGLSLGEALSYISENYKCEIGKLLRLAQVKIFEGCSKIDAYHMVAKLSFCNDFKTVIKILMQAEIIGNPISNVLKDMSKVIRNNQRDLMKIKSERLESNLVIIIFIFMFIPTVILFLLPVIPQLKLLF